MRELRASRRLAFLRSLGLHKTPAEACNEPRRGSNGRTLGGRLDGLVSGDLLADRFVRCRQQLVLHVLKANTSGRMELGSVDTTEGLLIQPATPSRHPSGLYRRVATRYLLQAILALLVQAEFK